MGIEDKKGPERHHRIYMMRERVFRHFKGDAYIVVGPVFDATNDEWVVQYQAHKSNIQTIYTRTLEDFESMAAVPRFTEEEQP